MTRRGGILAALILAAMSPAVDPPAPVHPVPTPQQAAWQRLEMTMFHHVGVNTFTDREWGDGKENPAIFNPEGLDARQWVRAAKDAGFGLMILTAKHHDGFCLWPSKLTDHGVRSSPWKGGKGDVVREFVDACRAADMKIGLYLSPWDRHEKTYGSDDYNAHFKGQLTELLTQYGTIDELWFDGACGEGPNGRKQVYDWAGYYGVIRRLMPKAVIAICGPDIRWVGNESGVARPGESSVQKRGNDLVWYPAECDVSIRPGWFYHKGEDGRVKPLDHLLDIYYKSVGRNSVLLLNVPPDRRGLFADADLARLREFRAAVDAILGTSLAAGRPAKADAVRGEAYSAARALDGKLGTYWAVPDGAASGWIEVDLGEPREFNVVNVQEPIELGERSKKYSVQVERDGAWAVVGRGTVIGHRNLLRIPRVTARRVRLAVEEARGCPAISEFGLYFSPRDAERSSSSLAAHKPAEASSVHPQGTIFGGDKAVDDDTETRWATSDETRACWLEVDLLREESIGRIGISELDPRITKYEILVKSRKEDPWKTAHSGGKAGKKFACDFPPVKARYVRLNILEATNSPTIWEFQLFPPSR